MESVCYLLATQDSRAHGLHFGCCGLHTSLGILYHLPIVLCALVNSLTSLLSVKIEEKRKCTQEDRKDKDGERAPVFRSWVQAVPRP